MWKIFNRIRTQCPLQTSPFIELIELTYQEYSSRTQKEFSNWFSFHKGPQDWEPNTPALNWDIL